MNDPLSEKNTAGDYLQLHSAEALPYRLEIAGLGARAHAFIIDWHIRLLLALAWLLVAGFGIAGLENISAFFKADYPAATWAWALAPAGLVYFLYHPVLEWVMAGRTPGKRMAGVRLVDLRGHAPGAGAILLRNVFRLVDTLPAFYVLGLIVVALTSNKVRIGDLAAGLVLVYDNPVKPQALQQIAALALDSGLSVDDQTLLLDLLARWDELSSARRIDYAQQFFIRIGRDIPGPYRKHQTDRAFKRALENVLTQRHGKT